MRLGEVCEIIAGQSPPSDTYRKSPGGLPFFQGKADFGNRHPVARTWCIEPTKVAQAGDILISVRAPVGPTNVADVECGIGRGLAAIRPGTHADRDFVLAALRLYEDTLAELGTGSTFEAIKRDDLESLEIPLPPLTEQKRIAAILNEQMAAVKRARTAAETQLEAAKALPAVYLRVVFSSPDAQRWPRRRLGEVCELLPSKSIATDGDTEVLAITTACLTESGFQPSGVKRARMWASDVTECVVSPGEILIARSNTPDLVGRVAMFSGNPKEAVASDLTIRLRGNGESVNSAFLTAYLSFLYLTGYWKVQAAGASGSMKKITRTQIQEERVPVPPISEQRRIAVRLSEEMAAVERTRKVLEDQLATINTLPAALLRRAFNGELTQRRALQVERRLPKGIFFKRAAIASYIINRLHKQSTFGRVQFEKVLYLTEAHVGIDLAGRYKREAAGPLDSNFLYKLESLASKQHWFTKHQRGAEGFFYRPGSSISDRLGAAETILGDRRKEMDRLLNLIGQMKTERVEVLATVFAVWNDFLLDSQQPTDEQIIREVRERWHAAKERFTPNQLRDMLDWMRKHNITPRGVGPRTEVTNGQA